MSVPISTLVRPAVTFPQLLATVPEPDRYELEERAAIYEFEGGMSREQAEENAAHAYLLKRKSKEANS